MNAVLKALVRGAKSWKTTTVAVLVAVVALANALIAAWDSDPSTAADWNVVVTAIMAAVGLFLAKDSDQDDEKVFVDGGRS